MQLKRIFVYAVFMILIVSTITAESIGAFKKDSKVTLVQTCSNCTYNNITSVTYPNSSVIVLNSAMNKSGTLYYYDFYDTSDLGIYKVQGVGDLNGIDTVWNYEFEITNSGSVGKLFSEGKSRIIFISFAVLFFTMVLCFLGASSIPSDNKRNDFGEIISLNYLKYLKLPLYFLSWMLLCAVFYVSSNLASMYLETQLHAKILFAFFTITFSLTPLLLVLWLIHLFLMILKDKELKKYLSRGFFPKQI